MVPRSPGTATSMATKQRAPLGALGFACQITLDPQSRFRSKSSKTTHGSDTPDGSRCRVFPVCPLSPASIRFPSRPLSCSFLRASYGRFRRPTSVSFNLYIWTKRHRCACSFTRCQGADSRLRSTHYPEHQCLAMPTPGSMPADRGGLAMPTRGRRAGAFGPALRAHRTQGFCTSILAARMSTLQGALMDVSRFGVRWRTRLAGSRVGHAGLRGSRRPAVVRYPCRCRADLQH